MWPAVGFGLKLCNLGFNLGLAHMGNGLGPALPLRVVVDICVRGERSHLYDRFVRAKDNPGEPVYKPKCERFFSFPPLSLPNACQRVFDARTGSG